MIFKQRPLENIMEIIEKKALSYTPEWRFDRENPDVGTTLSLVFADMIFRTYEKLELLPMKNKIAFFNELDTSVLPGKASWGYVAFSMVENKAEGQEILSGTRVMFEGEGGERVLFKTLNDLYAVGTNISTVLFTHAEKDFIREDKPLLFSCEGENLQKHELYLAGGRVFDLRSYGRITLKFFLGDSPAGMEEMEKAFSSGDMVFEYSTADGYREFKNTEWGDEGISFIFGRKNILFEEREERGCISRWIRFRLKDYRLCEKFSFDRIVMSSACEKRLPEIVFSEGEEVPAEEFYPFGLRFTDYGEAYIASDEILGKKGAKIELSFSMEFERIPINETDVSEIQWEWVMKESEIKKEPEYEILIEEVVWEYYNGKGWKRLLLNNGDIRFYPEKGRESRIYSETVSFVCPSDMEPILIDFKESYYIRLRIIRVRDLFKPRGHFITPLIRNLTLKYSYESTLCEPYIFMVNNREIREQKRERERIFPFYGIKEKKPAMYFGFDMPLRGGPVKIYFNIFETKRRKRNNFLWEYYNGRDWRELDFSDETEGFMRSGIITFMAYMDMEKKEIYGTKKYWLRVTFISKREVSKFENKFSNLAGARRNASHSAKDEKESFPTIKGIYMNCVKVCCISKGGEYTNIREEKQGRLLEKIRNVKGVSSIGRMMGGSNEESVEEALWRSAACIRNQGMAVTIRDFEEISKIALRSVHRVRCFSGYGENGERKSGVLTLLVLLKNYKGDGGEFHSVKLELENYLRDRMSSSILDLGRIFIREPYFIELNVRTELSVNTMEEVFRVKTQTEKRLRDFLDPISGGFDNAGWDIGTIPDIVQLKNAISNIEGVKYINNLYVNLFLREGGECTEVEYGMIQRMKYVLPVSGEHEIIVNV